MTEAPIHTFDQDTLSAWQAELKATRNPIIKEQRLRPEPDLLPRFTEHYQQLRALRRRVRRGLQRHWKRSLAGVAMLMELGQVPAVVATISVGGKCTLAHTITAANNDSAAGGRLLKQRIHGQQAAGLRSAKSPPVDVSVPASARFRRYSSPGDRSAIGDNYWGYRGFTI